MTDAEKPRGAARPFPVADDVRSAWDEFRAGAVVGCPKDGGPMALAVDAAANAYRLVCTRCGTTSPWFESDPHGFRIRASVPSQRPSEE